MVSCSTSPDDSARVVLEGVPRVGFYPSMRAAGEERCPEDVPFPSCLRACLEYLGENLGCKHVAVDSSTWGLGCAYAYLMGTSGAAFRLLWKPGWHPDNVDVLVMAEDANEPFRRAFEAVGYAHEMVGKEEGRDDEVYFRQRIVESIREKGRPVIGFGVIGPPECCIITGYDEHGDALVGWSYFQGWPEFKAQIEFEPSGYFRKPGWFEDTPGLILIGEKGERPPQDDIYREALRWAIEIARTPMVHDRHNGLAAYAAWADALVRDDDFATGDMAVLRECHMAHDDAVGTVAEGRWYGALFLMRIAEHVPAMASELLAAASCYAAEHDLMWEIWNLAGFMRSDAVVAKFADPAVRRQIVAIILQAREKDAEAAEHIERALAK